MADQVVLLKDGRIQQIGTPAELYETPVTTFAASFLGPPPMNIIRLDQLGDADAEGGLMPGARPGWSLGIRPENVHISQSGVPVTVVSADYMGAETILRLKRGQQVLMARIAGRTMARAGDELHVTWKSSDLHMFDERGLRFHGEQAASSSPA